LAAALFDFDAAFKARIGIEDIAKDIDAVSWFERSAPDFGIEGIMGISLFSRAGRRLIFVPIFPSNHREKI